MGWLCNGWDSSLLKYDSEVFLDYIIYIFILQFLAFQRSGMSHLKLSALNCRSWLMN